MLSRFYSNLPGSHSSNEVNRIQEQKTVRSSQIETGSSWTNCLKKMNCRSKRRDSIIIFDSKATNINTTVASTPLFSALRSPRTPKESIQIVSHFEVEPVRGSDLDKKADNNINDNQIEGISHTQIEEINRPQREGSNELTQIGLPPDNKNQIKCTARTTFLIGSKILLTAGVILSGVETYLILVSENKDKAQLTRWGLVAGSCLGPLLVTTERGCQLIRTIAAEAGLIITAQGLFVNLFGWRSPMGQLIQALSSPFMVSSVFSANLTMVIASKTLKKKHARSVSDSKNLIGPIEIQPGSNTFKKAILDNKISLLASSILIAGGSIGWHKNEDSFYYDILFQSAIRLGTIITSKVFSHYFLDPYFIRFKNLIAPTGSFISSILLSEVVSNAVGPIPTFFLMSGLGTVLATDQTIKTHQVLKKIKLMKELVELLKKNPDFVNALKQIITILNIPESPAAAKSKFGFTKKNKTVFALLIGLVIGSPFLSGLSGLVQFSVAYVFLSHYFYGSNYFRLNPALENASPRSCSKKMVEKLFINPLSYIARISLYPQTVLWGYYVNHVWTGAYNALSDPAHIPNSISYGVTPGDFALFFGTVGGLYSRRYTSIEWDKISENGLKTLVKFLKNEGNTKDYEFTITNEEIAWLAKMACEKDSKIVTEENASHVEKDFPVPNHKPWLRVGYHENKAYCQLTINRGFFSKKLQMNNIPNHEIDIRENTKVLYTAMVSDVIRLIR